MFSGMSNTHTVKVLAKKIRSRTYLFGSPAVIQPLSDGISVDIIFTVDERGEETKFYAILEPSDPSSVTPIATLQPNETYAVRMKSYYALYAESDFDSFVKISMSIAK